MCKVLDVHVSSPMDTPPRWQVFKPADLRTEAGCTIRLSGHALGYDMFPKQGFAQQMLKCSEREADVTSGAWTPQQRLFMVTCHCAVSCKAAGHCTLCDSTAEAGNL